MIKASLSLGVLLVVTGALTVQASSIDYVETHRHPDEIAQQSDDDNASATFQVTKVKYNRDAQTTTIKGLVVFPRSTEYGTTVWPKVYDQRDNTLVANMPSATRIRGQRRLNISTDVRGRYYMRDLEGRI